MIEVESVSKVYQERAVVSDVSFAVAAGETLVLLGTSGSGKTTLLKMINRLVDPSTGSIRIDGVEIDQEKPEVLRRKIGYVIQQSGLFPHYTVAENIGLVPSLLGWSATKIEQRVRELVKVVGLSEDHQLRYPNELSGGQQQRVGVARALAADPPVILMDEPFGALDPITKQQMAQEFASLGMLQEKTVVLVTHDVLEAFALGDCICLLDAGNVQQIGTPKDLLFHPKNEFVRSFFRTQQLRLALEVVALKDILALHRQELTTTREEKNVVTVEESASVFKVLEKLEQKNTSHIVVKGTHGEADRMIDRDQLLSWFFRYQH